MKRLLSIAVLVIALAFGGTIVSQAKIVQLDEDTLMLVGEISTGDSAAFYRITDAMETNGVKDIQFLIDSEGGLLDESLMIIDIMQEMQQERGVTITTVNVFEALSGGGYLWLFGDVRQAVEGAMFMYHTVIVMSMSGVLPFRLMPPDWQLYVLDSNYTLRQLVLDRLRDTALVNVLMGGGYGASNYFTIDFMDAQGLIDKIL